MGTRPRVYIESGAKRVFAAALEWPGWCRSGKTEQAAMEALVAYGPRYAEVVGRSFNPPKSPGGIEVFERLTGDTTTDFGAPSVPPAFDTRRLSQQDLKHLTRLLERCWEAFDETAAGSEGVALRKGPRGGGREIDAIVDHVFEAEQSYLPRLGGRYRRSDGSIGEEMQKLRRSVLEALIARTHGELEPPSEGSAWEPRTYVRRSAWHALDHAWEIEDRTPA